MTRPPVSAEDGRGRRDLRLTLRVDTPIEADYLRHGSIQPDVLGRLLCD